MNRYYLIVDYAKKQNVDVSTIHRAISGKKYNTIEVAPRLGKLVVEKVNDEPHIVSLMNLKGGCGKTTLAVHLASMLSKLKFKVLLIDTDHQNQCELFFPQNNYYKTLLDAIDNNSLSGCIYETQTRTSILDIVYSDYNLALIDFTSTNLISELIEPVKQNYDFIIIDTSPNFDKIAQSVVKVSNSIIIPVIPNIMNMKGMEHYLDAIEKVSKRKIADVLTGIVPTIVETRTTQHNMYLEALEENYPDWCYENYIPKDAKVSQTSELRTNVFDYHEKSKGSQAFKKIVWETLRRLK